jgi:gamma-glutamyltranspeptidase/glutathione hydrolase
LVGRWLVLAAASVVLAACESAPPMPLGTVGYVEGFTGRVVADEPLAVQVGEEVLSAGGTAADAATALYFTLAVTLPSRASLGGGGVCVVHDNPTQKTQTLEFLPAVSAQGAGGSRAPVAVPGNPRGLFALHSQYGRLLWEQLLAPAENLTRSGYSVSRALAEDLRLAAAHLLKDSESSRIFTRQDGAILREGDTLYQADLGVLLSDLRRRGPGEFYEGMLAPAVVRRFAEAAGTAKGAVTIDDMRDYQPEWRQTVAVAHDPDTSMHFAPPPAAAGAVAAEMWLMLGLDDRYKETPAEERGHLFAEVSMRAFADRGRWLKVAGGRSVPVEEIVTDTRAQELMASFEAERHTPAQDLAPAPTALLENPAATGFVVVDREGSAVACSLTMNNLFGLGRIARGTGIVMATAPAKGSGTTALLPMLMVNHSTGEFLFAASASGGAAAPTALMTVAVETLVSEHPLDEAIAGKRLHHSGVPDMVLYERGASEEALLALAVRGHRVFEIEGLGLVNVVYCPGGLPKEPSSCQARSDPRGFGAS